MDWFVRACLRFRYVVWWSVLAAAALLWWSGRPVAFDQSIAGFFPAHHPDLLKYERAKRLFGGDDLVFVVYDDPRLWSGDGMTRLESLAETISRQVPGIVRVESLAEMPVPWSVDDAVQRLASSSLAQQLLALPSLMASTATIASRIRALEDQPAELQQLRRRLTAHPLFRDLMVSADGQANALVVRLGDPEKNDSRQSVGELRRVTDDFAGRNGLDHIAVAGPPVLLADGFIMLERDNRTLGFVAMGLMAVTMLVALRQISWAIIPLISGGTSWLVMQHLLNFFGIELTLSSGPIIAQSIVLCMPAASHLAIHFHEAAAESGDEYEAARRTLTRMAAPVAWCTLTATVGYLALLTSFIRPVIQFSLVMAACSLIGGTLAFLLAPAAMRRSRSLAPGPPAGRAPLRVSTVTSWAIQHPWLTLALFLLPAVVVSAGIRWLTVESNYIRIFKPHSRVAADYDFVESRMGGIGLVELVVEAPSEVTHVWLEELRDVSRQLAQRNADDVSKVMTLADVVLPASGESPGGTLSASDRQRALEIRLQLLNTPAYAHLVRVFWNRKQGQMRVIVRIRESMDAGRKAAVFQQLEEQLAQSLELSGVQVTGLSQLMTKVTHSVLETQFRSAAWSGGAILLMLWMALRNVRLAVMALLPTGVAVGLVLGIMGWSRVHIDISTALVTSVAIGLSVDDTFHCLLRWRRELRAGRQPLAALHTSYAGTGPGVVLSSSAVSLGFLALVFSDFVPTANFGWLVAFATLGGSLGNLLLLPACIAATTQSRSSPNS